MTIQRFIELFTHISRYIFHHYCKGYYFFGTKIAIDSRVKVYNSSNISIGNNVHLQDQVWLNVIESTKKLVLCIGEGCDIGRNSFITAKKAITIEDHVLIAPNVFISDHSHKFDDPTLPILSQGITSPAAVRIGAESWLGTNVVILPGTIIGKHCVVGANSVVKGIFPDYSLIVGSPARRKRKIISNA